MNSWIEFEIFLLRYETLVIRVRLGLVRFYNLCNSMHIHHKNILYMMYKLFLIKREMTDLKLYPPFFRSQITRTTDEYIHSDGNSKTFIYLFILFCIFSISWRLTRKFGYCLEYCCIFSKFSGISDRIQTFCSDIHYNYYNIIFM